MALTKTDLENSSEVPVELLPVPPPFGPDTVNNPTQLWVKDRLWFFWEFWCVMLLVENCRIDGVDYYARTKPHLYAEEWLKFVSSKGLKARDRVVLDKEEDEFRTNQVFNQSSKVGFCWCQMD